MTANDQLVPRACAGDKAALDALFERLRSRIRNFIQSRVRPEYRAHLSVEEVLQDTFVSAFRSLERFVGNDEDTFRRWLSGIANKAVLRAEEHVRRHQVFEIDPKVPARGVSPSKALRRNERFDRFQEALDALSDDHRKVLYLTRIEGLSLKEVAHRMGRSEAAIKMLFSRALKKLRSTMTETESLALPDRELDAGEGRDDG